MADCDDCILWPEPASSDKDRSVRIWNSLKPTIAAVSAFLIAVTTFILAIEAILRPRLGQRHGRA
jgi:hypothetical protein